METKMKLSEVLHINDEIRSIIDNNNIKIDVLLKFRLLGIMKAFESHVVSFNVIKNEKIMEYGTETDDGIFKIEKDDPVSLEKFKSDINQLLDSIVSINLEMLRPAEIFDKGLNSDHLINLYPIICK